MVIGQDTGASGDWLDRFSVLLFPERSSLIFFQAVEAPPMPAATVPAAATDPTTAAPMLADLIADLPRVVSYQGPGSGFAASACSTLGQLLCHWSADGGRT